jgi:hypothetical protein
MREVLRAGLTVDPALTAGCGALSASRFGTLSTGEKPSQPLPALRALTLCSGKYTGKQNALAQLGTQKFKAPKSRHPSQPAYLCHKCATSPPRHNCLRRNGNGTEAALAHPTGPFHHFTQRVTSPERQNICVGGMPVFPKGAAGSATAETDVSVPDLSLLYR